jgi:hypothetical protein
MHSRGALPHETWGGKKCQDDLLGAMSPVEETEKIIPTLFFDRE